MSEPLMLTVPEVAEELQTEPLAVFRIIARRRLKAGSIPNSSGPPSYRIERPELIRYINAKSPDLKMPPIEGQFLGIPTEVFRTGSQQEQLRLAALALNEQRLSNEEARQLADEVHESKPRLMGHRLKLNVTPAVRALWNSPLPPPITRHRDAPAYTGPISTHADLIVASVFLRRLQDEAVDLRYNRPRRANPDPLPLVSLLYESPETHAALVAAAIGATVQSTTAPTRQTVDIESPNASTFAIDYVFQLSDLTTAQYVEALAKQIV